MINIVGEKNDYSLQKVSPFFTDKSGHFYQKFEKKIETLDGKNSETTHCIEDFLVRSEKEWFDDFRNAKLGLRKRDSHSTLATTTRTGRSRPVSMVPSEAPTTFPQSSPDEEEHGDAPHDDFMLGDAYQPPRGLRKWMQVKLGYWPLYAYFLALGQIIAANSYQMVLLTGEVGQSAAKLYTVASIYLAASVLWWYLFRRFASFVSLSLPFAFYGLAFFLVGLAPFLPSYAARGWTQNVATASYTIASASGSLFFSLNFGDEGAAPVSTWVLRACVIQGLQQLYTVALWFWGSFLAARARLGLPPTTTAAGTWKIAAGTLPLAAALWIIAAVMWSGLPPYYRQTPGHMPSFYRSIARRKVILWFFVTAAVQNFFLSAPAGRNWSFLFHSAHASPTQILGLVALFFGAVWAALCLLFARLSRAHSWILPLFALGLGAPRWAQIWWGTSAVALWLPWAPGSVADGSVYVAAALLARALWLWLGVLDAVQAVGLGMVLLGTLTRTHVAFAGVAMQVVGSLATMLGRAVGPNRVGPGPISPDISGGIAGLGQAWFWVGLGANLGLCVGFYRFYRKEQLMKP
jgi:alpha-1,3-glucan synthase